MSNILYFPSVRRMRETQQKQCGVDNNQEDANQAARDIARSLLAFLPYDDQTNPQAIYDLTNVLMDLEAIRIDNEYFTMREVLDNIVQGNQAVFDLARKDGKL